MAFSFILPDIGEGVVEGEVVRWHVKPGDVVKEDQTLVEIMTDKATVQIPSPKAGKVQKLNYKEGEVAKVGKSLLEIETAGDSKPAAPAPAAAQAAPQQQIQFSQPAQPAPAARREEEPRVAVAAAAPLQSSVGDRELLATPAVRKLARDEGVELAKLTGTGPNGRITREDVLKAAQGSNVISFQPPAQPQQQARPQERYEAMPRRDERLDPRERERFEREQAQPPQAQPQQAVAQRQEQGRQEQQGNRQDGNARPDRQGGGQQQGQQRDQGQQRQEQQRPAQAPAVTQPAAQVPAPAVAQGGETRQPIRGLRKRIYEKMHTSKTTAAHFTYVEEIDFTELVKFRETINQKYASQGVKLNFLPFIMKAVVAALRKFPQINAHVDDARMELVVKHEFNLGIATQTDDGLMVPVVRNCDQKSILQLAKEVAVVSDKAKKRQASSQELSGSTFTITSLGALGGVLATPVINYPEVAILGIHQIKKKPAVIGDQIVIRDLANFAASFDHRIIDGYVGAQWMAEVKRLIEDPQTLFLEL